MLHETGDALASHSDTLGGRAPRAHAGRCRSHARWGGCPWMASSSSVSALGSPRVRTPLGGIEARARHPEDPTQRRDRVVGPLRADEAMHGRYLRPVSVRRRPRLFSGSRAPRAAFGSGARALAGALARRSSAPPSHRRRRRPERPSCEASRPRRRVRRRSSGSARPRSARGGRPQRGTPVGRAVVSVALDLLSGALGAPAVKRPRKRGRATLEVRLPLAVGCALVLALGAAKAGELLLDELVHHLDADTRPRARAEPRASCRRDRRRRAGPARAAPTRPSHRGLRSAGGGSCSRVFLWIGLCPSRSPSERGRRTAPKFNRVRHYLPAMPGAG